MIRLAVLRIGKEYGMKKFASVVMALALSLCMFGCGKPAGMSQEAYDIGNDAVAVTEKYLEGEISSDEAADELQKFSDEMDSAPAGDSGRSEIDISADIGYLHFFVSAKKDEEAKTALDSLKKTLTDL